MADRPPALPPYDAGDDWVEPHPDMRGFAPGRGTATSSAYRAHPYELERTYGPPAHPYEMTQAYEVRPYGPQPPQAYGTTPYGPQPPQAHGRAQPQRSGPPMDPRSYADAPMLDHIFPNRPPPAAGSGSGNGSLPTPATVEARAGFGATGRGRRSGAHSRRAGSAGRGVRRRRVLAGLGAGAFAFGGAGGAAALLSDVVQRKSEQHSWPDTAVEGLGAEGLADSPAAAAAVAATATPTWPTPLSRDPELHLLRRATFGPTLLDVVAVRQLGIDAWLERQFDPATIDDPIVNEVLKAYPTVHMSTAEIRAAIKENDWLAMQELGQATLARQLWSNRQLFEVMVDFWSNHLNVTNPFGGGWDVRTSYDNDVIRKHALGRFSDMLLESAKHPAMMRYLDNARSHRRSVNENYGRELLELHTVGIEAGYTEEDVRNSAYIMTGRTVDREGRFYFDPGRHWTGEVKVLDFTHKNKKASQGMKVGDAYLRYLAMHPATAQRIAFKLARRFVCDDPPLTLVERLKQSYLDNGSAIVPMLRTLFSSVEFWMSVGLKTRRPLENVVATARILGVAPGEDTAKGVEGLYWMTSQLGHAPLNWSPPDGYPDVAEAWGSAHATLGTWNAHRALVQGWHRGLAYAAAESLVGVKPATVGEYLDTLSLRLVHQPMLAAHKKALLNFLDAKEGSRVKNVKLGGMVEHIVPLVLDSVYHALR